jgi:hypothetical protein
MDEAEKQIIHSITVHATEIRRHELITLSRWTSAQFNRHGFDEKGQPDGDPRRTDCRVDEE